MNYFGEHIRKLREKQNLFLRHVAPELEMDTAQLSKIEKGIRQIKPVQISKLAIVLNADSSELKTLWLADQISNLIAKEPLAEDALKIVVRNFKKDTQK